MSDNTKQSKDFRTQFQEIVEDYTTLNDDLYPLIQKIDKVLTLSDCEKKEHYSEVLELKIFQALLNYKLGKYKISKGIYQEIQTLNLNTFLAQRGKINLKKLVSFQLMFETKYQECIELSESILEDYDQSNFSKTDVVMIHFNLANAYFDLGYFHKSLLNFLKVRSLMSKDNKRIAIVNYNIICCLSWQARFKEAEAEILDFDLRMGDNQDSLVQLFLNASKAIYNLEYGEYNKCIEYCAESRKFVKPTGLNSMNGPLFSFLSDSYLNLKDYNNSAHYAIKLHKFALKQSITNYTIKSLLIIGNIMINTQEKLPDSLKEWKYLEQFNYNIEEFLFDTESLINEYEIQNEKLNISELLLEYFLQHKKYNQATYYFKIIRKIEAKIYDIKRKDLEFRLEAEFKQSQHLKDIEHKDILLKEQEEISERLESFARTVSHDMKEPLRTIRSFGQLLRRQNKEILNEESNEYLDFIIDASKRMNQQIDDLLNYAKLGVNMPDAEPVDLNDVIILAKRNLYKQITGSDISIILKKLPTIKAHFSIILAIFQNLLSNAIKFRREEKLIIEIDCKELSEEFWQISVKDNGIGMPPNMLDQIFMTFKRLHSYADIKGTGIGLATCKKSVELYGGKIWVESVEGEGSTFFFTLPKAKN